MALNAKVNYSSVVAIKCIIDLEFGKRFTNSPLNDRPGLLSAQIWCQLLMCTMYFITSARVICQNVLASGRHTPRDICSSQCQLIFSFQFKVDSAEQV